MKNLFNFFDFAVKKRARSRVCGLAERTTRNLRNLRTIESVPRNARTKREFKQGLTLIK
jgi:hypothetical protein